MKKITLLILLFIAYSGISQQYLLKDDTVDKNYLASFIEKNIEEGNIKPNPIIILNEMVLTSTELENFPFSKDEILSLAILNKDSEKLIETYGNNAKNGVVLIKTKKKNPKPISESQVLYILDGVVISESDIKNIDESTIDTIQVLKDKSTMSEYNAANYDGIIIITSKN